MSSGPEARRLKIQKKLRLPFKSEGRKEPMSQVQGRRSSLLLMGQLFCSGQAFTDWVRPTCIREGK